MKRQCALTTFLVSLLVLLTPLSEGNVVVRWASHDDIRATAWYWIYAPYFYFPLTLTYPEQSAIGHQAPTGLFKFASGGLRLEITSLDAPLQNILVYRFDEDLERQLAFVFDVTPSLVTIGQHSYYHYAADIEMSISQMWDLVAGGGASIEATFTSGSTFVLHSKAEIIPQTGDIHICCIGSVVEVDFSGTIQESSDLHRWTDVSPQPHSPWQLKPGAQSTFYRIKESVSDESPPLRWPAFPRYH